MKTENSVKVWDGFVRIFHWGLVLAFTIAYVTEEHILSLHSLAGYVVIGLIGLRLVWGFIGPEHARFANFAYSPATIKQFLQDTLRLRARRYLGHNPAGGAMIFLLLISLVLTVASGLVIYAGAEHAGPLAGLLSGMSHDTAEVFEEVHEFFANLTLLLILVHVAGVIVESFLHRENLVRAMLTGFKRELTADEKEAQA